MSLVVDVSVAAKWFLRDEKDRFADEILHLVSKEAAFVPALFRWELENVLLSAERAGRVTSLEVDDALEAILEIPIFVESLEERLFFGSELQLARHYGLTSYDAAYLALAAVRRVPLATRDSDLAHAGRELGIALLSG